MPPPPGHGAMYNGIGLPTPRGSGTNSYVQRNLSLVRGRRGERPDYKGEEELRRLEAALVKRPNPDILDHEHILGIIIGTKNTIDREEKAPMISIH